MRIISKFHDYYDAGMGQGQDLSLVFVREMACIEYDGHKITSLPAVLQPLAKFEQETRIKPLEFVKPSKIHSSIRISFGVVLFAGKVYPLAQVKRDLRLSSATSENETLYVYDYEQLKSIASAHGVDLDAPRKISWQDFEGRNNSVVDFFSRKGDDRFHEMATNASLPVVVCAPFLIGEFNQTPLNLTVNARLSEIQFFRQFGPFEAFQEIAMFMGNIAAPDRTPVVIADKYRIPQHGFDKYSFRKRPKDNSTESPR